MVEAGGDITRIRVGDRVVLSAVPSCGTCWFCSRGEPYLCAHRYSLRRPPFLDGSHEIRGASGLGTFSDSLVVDERAAVVVDTDLPAEQLAVLGCAVLTGTGAALNIARLRVGDSVVVVGAGGVGLAAIQGARIAGAAPIVAIDPSEDSRRAARSAGATMVVEPGDTVTDAVLGVTDGRGADVAIECVGTSASFAATWPTVRRGGEIVLVGVGHSAEPNPIPLLDVVLSGRRVTGCVYGQSSVHRDIPRYVALAESGGLDLAALIGRRVALEEIPQLLDAPAGHGRTVVVSETTAAIPPEE